MKMTLKRRGVALSFILGVVSFISILLFGMIYRMRGETVLSGNYVDATAALILAEAGAEEALFNMRTQLNNPDYPLYKLVANEDSGSLMVDTERLAKGDTNVAPLLQKSDIKVQVDWQLDKAATQNLISQGVPPGVARQGYITINSMGKHNNTKKQIEMKKLLKAVLMKTSEDKETLGVVAPAHSFFADMVKKDSFEIAKFDILDPWGFTVKGGKAYFKNGAVVDLPKWLMLTKLSNQLEHPWIDMGIGWTGWNGGADFSETQLEYTDSPVKRHYNKWQGPFSFPWWQGNSSEKYHAETTQVGEYSDKDLNIYPASVYKSLATRVIDPKENPKHGKYFTNVKFQEAFGRNEVNYTNVLPMYGWGDWRNVPNKFSSIFSNPTKAHDFSRAVEVNGITYVKGDVFIEGWVKGQGLLVVEGNVYVGGDILTTLDENGNESALGIIALRDKTHDTSSDNPRTGRIIYEPHHDSDWSRYGITHPFRNLSPRLEGAFYAEGGMELKTDSSMKKLINMDIIGNLAVGYFNRKKMPNDVRVTYFDWQKVLENSGNENMTVSTTVSYSDIYNVAIQKPLISWREVTATL